MRLIKAICVIVIFIAATAPLFLSAFFLGGRILIHRSMLEKMEIQHLTTVKIPEESFRWYNLENEIEINGRMFDVKSHKLINGVYLVTGLYDEMETALNEKLNKILENNDPSTDSNLIFQVSLGIEGEEKLFCQFQFYSLDEVLIQKNLFSDMLKPQHHLDILSPPPKI